MGGTNFTTIGKGKTVDEAYEAARQSALYEYGHRGYTGTIAEKAGYTLFTLKDVGVERIEGEAIDRLAGRVEDAILANEESRAYQVWDDKWGPAVAVEIEMGVYLFIGMASC